MTVSELSSACGFQTVCMPDGGREAAGAYVGDLLSWVMGRAKADNVWVTIMSNVNVVAVASLADVSCVILAEGVELDGELVKTAEEKSVNILRSDLPAFETAAMLAGKV